jgi:hypothetical protein
MKIITTKDLCQFKGVQLRAAQLEMSKIKDYHDKEKHQLVSSSEAAEYYGIPESLFLESLQTSIKNSL